MTFLRTHRIALLVALFVGSVAVAPSILGPASLGSEYRGVQFLPFSDDVRYLARIHEVLDGHILVSSPYLYEYKSDPVVVLPLNEWLYAIPAYIFGLSAVVVGSKFFLPTVFFFLVYFFVRKLIGKEEGRLSLLASVTAGLAVVFGADMVDYRYIFSLFSGAGVPHALLWTRLVNPIIGGIQIFGFLILLWCIWERKFRFAYIAAGVLLGSTVGYFFTLGMSLALLASVGALAFLRKEYDVALRTVYVLLISLVLDAWWWYHNLLTLGGGEAGKVTAMRNGMSFTHEPILNKALLAATLFVAGCFLYSYLRREWKSHEREWFFTFALILAGWIAFNQQIITGREIWYHHFVQYTVPLGILACIIALFLLLYPMAPRLLTIAMITISAVSVAYGLISVTNYVSRLPDLQVLQEYAPVLTWLKENAPKDCVVLSGDNDDLIERLVPAYTACNVYSTTSTFFGVSGERVVHNFLLKLRFSGISAEEVSSYLHTHEDDVRTYFFLSFEQIFGHGEEPWLLEKIAFLEKEYQMFSKEDLEQQIQHYRADYIIFGAPISSSLRRAVPNLTLATSTAHFYVYAF